jgi:hypothetical protein
MGENDNYQQFRATAGQQDATSLRLGIPINNTVAVPLTGITQPGCLPVKGPLRSAPSAVFGVRAGKSNRASK